MTGFERLVGLSGAITLCLARRPTRYETRTFSLYGKHTDTYIRFVGS